MVKPKATSPFFFFLLFLHIFIIANGVHSFHEKKLFNVQMLQRKQQLGTRSCFLPESRQEKGTVILEMKERDHCSQKKIDWNKRLQKQLILDDINVHSMQNRIRRTISSHIVEASETQIPLTSGINLQTLNYIVSIGLGSQNMTVIVDTGSDLTWIQCEPCMSCYNQQGPIFNPSTSSSYKPILCNSSTCQSLQSATGNRGTCDASNSSSCNYVVNYGDGSYTNGELGLEHLVFGGISVSSFVFGCGRNNKGLFGGVSGLMGLGRSYLSMISQTNATFGGVFSYCLPTIESGGSGSLVMGNNESSSVFKNVTPIAYTNMVLNPQLSNFYILNLTGIDVGGVALKSTSFGNGGMLIDSGTVITRLVPSVYKALKEEFLKQFSGYPSAPGFSLLDTCFNLTGNEEVSIPTIRLHFEDNAEMNVDVAGILYIVKDDASQVCLALASLNDESDIGIVGNYQQRNQRVIYDTKDSKVGFASEPCSFI
ncbi:PREDICTED: aspartyl protease family protein At5g10770 [Lupinus angustifolius]|uniref:aspartyl protease family protein At5g10770 n=1 Tax=Lupinus angustifolius TaxID=3871 RepID=UPI00092F5BBC|nr:PREDICTED: aspartyl protease family protein At5g10770 [Lupinus angustifolius]XP_019422112.1 PREDICTED: aspartyl protease family protein At5g10770 [Lupinus angustifolius]XP_019422113.1 PREDICTED: aspartyl protease family protein At5g10770 [Lupinus angustifolius]